MTIYFSFDPKTNELLGGHKAQVDPLETERRGRLVYCGLPPHSTAVKPPKIDAHQAAIWNGKRWDVVPDYRGQTWWRGEKAETVTALGDPKADGLSPTRIIEIKPGRIKGECRIRIKAVLSEPTQMNMHGNAAAGLLTMDQMAVYREALLWITTMRSASSKLIETLEPTFRDDKHWPECPAAVRALAKQF